MNNEPPQDAAQAPEADPSSSPTPDAASSPPAPSGSEETAPMPIEGHVSRTTIPPPPIPPLSSAHENADLDTLALESIEPLETEPFEVSSSPPIPPSPAGEQSPSSDPPKSVGGRPCILADPTKQAQILAVIATGAGMSAAAKYVGVHIQTLRRFIRTDHDFRQRVEQVQGRKEANMMQCVGNAAHKNWRAAQWYLQVANPGRYREQRLPSKAELQLLTSAIVEAVVPVIPDHGLKHQVLMAINKAAEEFVASYSSRRYTAQPPRNGPNH